MLQYFRAGCYPSVPKPNRVGVACAEKSPGGEARARLVYVVVFDVHDALEFPGGQIVMVTRLTPGQQATVLQLPAQPGTQSDASLKSASPVSAEV